MGEPLTFTARDAADDVPPEVELRLTQIDVVASRWKLTTTLPVTPEGDGWSASFNATGDLSSGVVYEAHLFAPHVTEGRLVWIALPAAEKLYFVMRGVNEADLSASDVQTTVEAVLRERQDFFDQPLGPRDASNEYEAVMLVGGLYLTAVLRAPGLEIRPLTLRQGPTWDGSLLNEILSHKGWQVGADLKGWSDHRLRSQPVAFLGIGRIRAHDEHEAHALAAHWAEAVLDVLALRRGARGTLLAAAVRGLSDHGSALIAPHGRTYQGNLLGGFISGEDPHGFVEDVRAVEADSRLALLLHLHAEAESEDNLDFAYFRFWGLLEMASTLRIPEAGTVTDFSGSPVYADGRRVTTSNTRGRVYEFIKRHYVAGSVSEARGDIDDSADMWNATAVWYGRRNATAHHGGFRPDDPLLLDQWWYPVTLAAYEAAQRDGGNDRFHDAYFRWLQDSAKLVISRELRGLPMAG
ncbi:MAG: hypothetical protein WEF28_04385 [Acidimicrobiia bacterium]